MLIYESTARIVAKAFYDSISLGNPIEVALTEGRKAAFSSINQHEWGIPALFMRSSDGYILNIDTVNQKDKFQTQRTRDREQFEKSNPLHKGNRHKRQRLKRHLKPNYPSIAPKETNQQVGDLDTLTLSGNQNYPQQIIIHYNRNQPRVELFRQELENDCEFYIRKSLYHYHFNIENQHHIAAFDFVLDVSGHETRHITTLLAHCTYIHILNSKENDLPQEVYTAISYPDIRLVRYPYTVTSVVKNMQTTSKEPAVTDIADRSCYVVFESFEVSIYIEKLDS